MGTGTEEADMGANLKSLIVLAAMLLAGATACQQDASGGAAAEVGTAPGDEAGAPAKEAGAPAREEGLPTKEAAGAVPKADLAALLAAARPHMPNDALAVVAFDPWVGARLLLDAFSLFSFAGTEQIAALRNELSAFATARLGFSPLDLEGVVVAVSDTAGAGVLIKGPFKPSATKWVTVSKEGGLELFALNDPPIVLHAIPDFGLAVFFGTEEAVMYLKALAAQGDQRPADARVERILAQMPPRPDTWLAAGVLVKGTMLENEWDPSIGFTAPDAAVLQATSDKLFGVLLGDKECLDGLMSAIEKVKMEAMAAIAAAKANLDDLDLFSGMGIIIADSSTRTAFDALKPVRGEGSLELGISIADYGMFLTLGILSAVAVPSFIKYQRKAKTSEAIENLDKIYKGAAMYYETPHVDQEGNVLPCQFPAPQGSTPGSTCCGKDGGTGTDGDDKCAPEPEAWNTPTWMSLLFAPSDPHYFVYSFDSNGKTGPEAQFTASAHADLDCDGIYSTFQRHGKGDPHSQGGDCSAVGAAAMFSNNETE